MTDDGEEPDYRYTLANERTLLAWVRTALGLLAGGVAVHQLVPAFGVGWARTAIAVACVVLAVFVLARGLARWRAVDAAMRAGAPLPRNTSVTVLVTVTVLIALLVGVLTVIG